MRTTRPAKRINGQYGFTIIELMIATIVFSLILLVITAAILQFSRQYYKGVVSSATQTASRTVMDDVTRAIQFSGGTVAKLTDGGSGWCIGSSKRYSYVLHKQIMDSGPVRHALVSDTVSGGCSTSTKALDVGSLPASLSGYADGRELLGEHMRLAKFEINGESPVYTITIRVVYGDDDLLTDPNSEDAACKTDIGSQFCAVSELTTTVSKRAQ